MNIPLVNNNSVDAINTSLIAIKKTVNSNNQIQDVDVNVGINIATNCTYCAASSTTIKGAQLYNGCSIKVLFTSAITGSDTTTPMSINYNSVSIPVKTGKNGVLSNFVANNINGSYIYCQAYTTLELLFDGTQFIIMGNPVVISSTDYTIYTDGTTKYTKVGVDNKTLGVPYVTGISYTSRDLNDYKSPVITFVNNNSGGWTNCPTRNALILVVLVSGNMGQTSLPYVRQILFGYNQSNLIYTRGYDPNLNKWDSWYRPA